MDEPAQAFVPSDATRVVLNEGKNAMNKLVNLSALAALSSALYFSPSAQACDGHEGKGGKAMSRMDKNSDGKVTQQEMLAAMTAHFERSKAQGAHR